MNRAENIAMQLGNDGHRWQTDDGRTLTDLCAGADVERGERSTRHGFADGSAIIAADGGWDVGIDGAACHCWASADNGEHNEDCAELCEHCGEVDPGEHCTDGSGGDCEPGRVNE